MRQREKYQPKEFCKNSLLLKTTKQQQTTVTIKTQPNKQISFFKETLVLDIYNKTAKKGKYLSYVNIFTDRNRVMQSS